VDTSDPGGVLKEVKRLLERNGWMSLSDLERSIGVTRNWLSGFMSALEALGVVECRGTRTFKLYAVKRGQSVA